MPGAAVRNAIEHARDPSACHGLPSQATMREHRPTRLPNGYRGMPARSFRANKLPEKDGLGARPRHESISRRVQRLT
jgi:hypothetical protein